MNPSDNTIKLGIDVGSTTIKFILLNQNDGILHQVYRRHKANIGGVFAEELRTIHERFPQAAIVAQITGSAGLGIAERTGIPFQQEVVASVAVVERFYPDTHTMIDLGGEDAKMVFFAPGRQPDIRMNGNCAGGTGAFIDQMADLMHITVEELGDLARDYDKIYPVASRCGVFAKTDVQNLICRNVPRCDVAASILHTVALQSITSLARGCEVSPKILCVGGPLTFLSPLREAFRRLLKLKPEDIILPDNSAYFPAWGCALSIDTEQAIPLNNDSLIRQLQENGSRQTEILPPLFEDEEAYNDWKRGRRIRTLKKMVLTTGAEVACFLGIDSGSTTTKIVVMNEKEELLYDYYANNEGNPLKKVVEGLRLFYERMEQQQTTVRIISSAVTGYGEDLVRSALNLDWGIVETMAHLSGAQYADPDASFVLDIGGQDIKSIFINQGVISNIELNEACSSGCGSFLQNFAGTMNCTLAEFAKAACLSQAPGDLGSRCTVFMNSKVKQALRQNAALGDIAAGLAYSVVKNCLFKVLKISNLKLLGEHIVVQGGTFRNDAVYRVLELLSGKQVSSTDHPELMGALGAALYARKMYDMEGRESLFKGVEALPDVEAIDQKEIQCKGCTNQCQVLRFRFENGNSSYAGNKCEKVFYSRSGARQKGYNAFEQRNAMLFERTAAVTTTNREEKPLRIGIPRILNMFDNYPFWHTLLTGCGMQVELSSESTFALYQKGAGSIMSENICFPAKLAHGHVMELLERGVDRIFYPIVPKEEKEFDAAVNSFNCPIVSGYPEVIRSAIDPAESKGIPFDKPVITLSNAKALEKGCMEYLKGLGIPEKVIRVALAAALKERDEMKRRLSIEQKRLFREKVDAGELVFVVAGRPYHTDPLINQKTGQILADLGVHVFTDDLFRREKGEGFSRLNIISQWSYPNRMVEAAMEVAKQPANVQYIQLNSFGCGPDSFFMDEVGDILKQAGKNHTILRIDEIASPGSIRLRLRSLIESLKVAQVNNNIESGKPFAPYPSSFTKSDRKKTILIPWFADFISPFLPAIGELAGYNLVNLPKSSKASAEIGLQYGHNEVCYPSTLVLGDIIMGLQSGRYDLANTVVAITQTGGQCRATNYIAQIKRGLQQAGFGSIPVLAISTGRVYQNDQKAFKVPVIQLINIILHGLLYADGLQQMYSSCIVREKERGETQSLFDFYVEQGIEAIRKNDSELLVRLLEQAVADFNQLPLHERRSFGRIGLIGEIYLKYNNYGQAHITEWLREREMEVQTPPIMDFVMPYFVNASVNANNGVERDGLLNRIFRSAALAFVNKRIIRMDGVMKGFRFYQPSVSIFEKADYASEVLDLSHQFGEGWSIAAEVACYARQGVNRVVCIQPFGCIANHVVARGIEKRLKKLYPQMNILYLDIDGGVADVNLQNRLYFILNAER